MSLINREELLKSIMDDNGLQYPRWWYVDKVKTAPEAVVRCKECRYWKTEHPKANGFHCCYRIHNAFPMREDDFCSRGVRR